jgi:hypothetical protein
MKKLVLAWAATAVAATGAAVGVLGLLGTGLTGASSHVLSQAEIRAALTTATSRAATSPAVSPPAVTPSGVATPSQTAPGKLIHSAGGTVIASCDGDQVTLRSWSPAQDYSVDKVEPGPARESKVKFEPHDGHDVELRITCSGGQPVTRVHS